MLFCQRKTIVSKITPKLRPSKEVHQSTLFPSSMSYLLSLSVDSTYGICSVLPKGKRRTGFIKRRGPPLSPFVCYFPFLHDLAQNVASHFFMMHRKTRAPKEGMKRTFLFYLFISTFAFLSAPLVSPFLL